MDKLRAVNNLLKLVGTRKVTSVDIPHPDVVDAVDVLEDWTEKLLKRGWWFNKMNAVTLHPDQNGFIQVPTNVIRFEYHDVRDKQVFPLLSLRGNRLLNVATNSFVFDRPITLQLYINLDWDDLPDSAQHYIAYAAGAEYVRDKIEDSQKVNSLKRDAQEHMNALDAEEVRTEQCNMFENPAAMRLRSGRRPFGRSGIPTE